MNNGALSTIVRHMPEIIFLLVFAIFGIPLLSHFANRAMKRFGVKRPLRHLLTQVTRVVAYILVVLSLLYSMGFTGLAATLSGSILLVGVALGQAFKDLLTDVISGFSMARDNDLNVGYLVQIGKDTRGVIKDIGLRKIRLVDEEGRLHVLANNTVERSEWIIVDREARALLDKEKAALKAPVKKTKGGKA